jgi:8-oxo-dGTP pyrophosphatase MutT (NUDIX family)
MSMAQNPETIVQEIPLDRLPQGFAARLESPPQHPSTPRPAATVALFRQGSAQSMDDPESHLPASPGADDRAGDGGSPGLEILLLQRVRSAGFVPGAYVFPGGRVDPSDGSVGILDHLDGADPREFSARLGIRGDDPPAFAYLVAALREAFEETGILPGLTRTIPHSRLGALRTALLQGETTFPKVLRDLDVILDARTTSYIAHWVTPEAEPRRYDTRFFAMEVPRGAHVSPQRSEVSQALWIEPGLALRRNRAGELPMVFPTIRTLEELANFQSADELRDHYDARRIPRILPRLVRTPTGVGISVPDTSTPSPDTTP